MNQLLPFLLGTETYALELLDIQEIVENRVIYPLPAAPEAVVGAISFHGRIMPVVDLPYLLGFPLGERTPRLIVLTDDAGPMALQVDQIKPVQTVDLRDATLTQSDSEEDCIRGVLNWKDQMISLLDLEQLSLLIEQLCSRTGG